MQRDAVCLWSHLNHSGGTCLIDIPTILVGALLSCDCRRGIEVLQGSSQGQKEYEEARESVEDIVLSFNRQLQHEAERLEAAAYKVEALSSKVEGVSKNVGQVQETLPSNGT